MRVWIIGALVLVLVGAQLVLRMFVIEAFVVPGASMAPTLNAGDKFFADKRDLKAARGDVIVFKYPPDPSRDYVKRVVAVGGDSVELEDRVLIVNGVRLPRVKVDRACEGCELFRETNGDVSYDVQLTPAVPARNGKWDVPQGSVFVMGDNRDNSSDSRFWGSVPLDHVKGRAWKKWWANGAAWDDVR